MSVSKKNKALLCYPPGALYQRGEDRSQGNIDDSSATAMRACNDLGYSAAALLKEGFEVMLRDWQTERKTLHDAETDTLSFKPDLVMISVTNATIYSDIEFATHLKSLHNFCVVLKGAIFFNPDSEMLALLNLDGIDYLIGGESECCIGGIAKYELRKEGDIKNIPNILYKDIDGTFKATNFYEWEKHLDEIPFPARHLMNNALYTRPDTQMPMATIQTSRGCPASCIYCLSPEISGRKIRLRSPANVMAEIKECYYEFGIKNFFFKADTFTINPRWTIELCNLIVNSPLHNKIEWTANSRTKPLERETLFAMKEAGCFAVAFGFESGSEDTLLRIKKGAALIDNQNAARWAREARLLSFGFFMIGFPWETKSHLLETRAHAFDLNSDFIECHIALPYWGTELFSICKQSGVLLKNTLGSDYFNSSTTGTRFVPMAELIEFRNKFLRAYYLRPSYIARRFMDCVHNPAVFPNYAKYALKLFYKEKNE
jgi:radical SAM superfamily enzyme YgiQ (UPF0313 family)